MVVVHCHWIKFTELGHCQHHYQPVCPVLLNPLSCPTIRLHRVVMFALVRTPDYDFVVRPGTFPNVARLPISKWPRSPPRPREISSLCYTWKMRCSDYFLLILHFPLFVVFQSQTTRALPQPTYHFYVVLPADVFIQCCSVCHEIPYTSRASFPHVFLIGFNRPDNVWWMTKSLVVVFCCCRHSYVTVQFPCSHHFYDCHYFSTVHTRYLCSVLSFTLCSNSLFARANHTQASIRPVGLISIV